MDWTEAARATRASIDLDAHLPRWNGHDLDLLADSLLRSSDVLIDELFYDVDVLASVPGDRRMPIDATMQVRSLPQGFSSRFSAYLVKKLILSAGVFTARFLNDWRGPDTVAECLVLDLLIENTAQWIEARELDLPDDWRTALEEALYLDLDHRVLYERSSWVGVPTRFAFDHWFESARGESQPPYVVLP